MAGLVERKTEVLGSAKLMQFRYYCLKIGRSAEILILQGWTNPQKLEERSGRYRVSWIRSYPHSGLPCRHDRTMRRDEPLEGRRSQRFPEVP